MSAIELIVVYALLHFNTLKKLQLTNKSNDRKIIVQYNIESIEIQFLYKGRKCSINIFII